MVNNFRLGKNAWQWNPDNKTKTIYNNLESLSYDYELEKIAMQRAAEIAVFFDHVRPNGNLCFSLTSNGTSSYGENVAAGYPSAKQVFTAWQETNENYNGQGHRRNMLNPEYTSIGIGHVYYNGVHYWVQEFGYYNSGCNQTSVINTKMTTLIKINNKYISSLEFSNSDNPISIDIGKSIEYPNINATLKLTQTYPFSSFSCTFKPSWKIEDSTLADLSNNKITGLKRGTTKLKAIINGKTIYKTLNITRPIDLSRYSGDNRYATSLLVANKLKNNLQVNKFQNIIVASGSNYPDALSGSYLAKIKNAPILLVDSSTENIIRSYINENLKQDGTIYLLGGSGVISTSFENSLKDKFNVKRLYGKDRYGTNLAVLKESNISTTDILICSGNGYADSLSASAVGKPILLVNKELLSEQEKYLNKLSITHMYLIGGTGAVNTKIENKLNKYPLTRYAGNNRYETSSMVADYFFGKNCETVVLAYGNNFPDGLSGGPLAMSMKCPLLLTTNSKSDALNIRNYSQSAALKETLILGGPSLICNDIAYYITK